MAALSVSAVCILCAAQPTVSLAVAQWQPLIAEAAAETGVPASWIVSVMQAESGGRITLHGQPITSLAGAMGLMQIMPGTYADLRRRYGLGPDPYDPHDNIFAGAAYLKAMYRRYGYPLLFAAYQAGPARVNAWLFDGEPLPEATRAYLRTIIPGVILPSRQTVFHAKSDQKSPDTGAKAEMFPPSNSVSDAPQSAAHVAIRPQNPTTKSVFVTTRQGAALFVPLSSRNR